MLSILKNGCEIHEEILIDDRVLMEENAPNPIQGVRYILNSGCGRLTASSVSSSSCTISTSQ